MNRRFAIVLVVLVAGAAVLAEVLLQPPAGDRGRLLVILALPAVVAAAGVPLLRRWVSSRPSVAGAALAVGATSLVLGASISSAASNAMFLSTHDYRLFLVVLALSGGLALAVGQQLSRPLADDIRRLERVAMAVADGDLDVHTGIDRRDEVGQTALAIDTMVERLRQAAAERDRLAAARQNLLTGVGHDLRTPLAAMRAATESLQDGVATDPDRYLSVIASQIQVIDHLIDQLFTFARLEAGGVDVRLEPVSLAELADDAVESLAPIADRAGVALDVRTLDAAPVEADPAAVSRVLRNLLDNAVRHSPPGGTVSVHVATTGEGASLRVDDEGQGFPPDFRDSAFEPFTRADAARTSTGSTGLGLAIARAIVDAHHGTIEILDASYGSVLVVLPSGHPRPTTASYSSTRKDLVP